MGARLLAPRTGPVAPGPSGLAPDLVHTTVVRTPAGAEFAVGWVDDTETGAGQPCQEDGTS